MARHIGPLETRNTIARAAQLDRALTLSLSSDNSLGLGDERDSNTARLRAACGLTAPLGTSLAGFCLFTPGAYHRCQDVGRAPARSLWRPRAHCVFSGSVYYLLWRYVTSMALDVVIKFYDGFVSQA
ncbi:hypothetical protein NDU88_000902 [Pleurodeles waltl]|uniref:Uncharacterized protein n=1 Tax=Pleurodeles waltl TaxID=8319 RepID=A0AAV7LBG7_PLEWA|nr:hypothetical protein NDU88_000902 [Pleurodeles waltl]